MRLRARQDKNAGGDARAPMSGIEVVGDERASIPPREFLIFD